MYKVYVCYSDGLECFMDETFATKEEAEKEAALECEYCEVVCHYIYEV